MECTRKQNRGFTLIELMVVILIIAILATLATMAGSSAIRAAKQARVKTELDMLAGALDSYKAKYGSYPPLTDNALRSHLQQKFPRIASSDLNTLPTNLQPYEILWLCLRGWSNDPQRPVSFFNASVKRDQFFEFRDTQLRESRRFPEQGNVWAFVYMYVPNLGKDKNETAPFVYFDCSRPNVYNVAQLACDFTYNANGPWKHADEHGAVMPYFTATRTNPRPNIVNDSNELKTAVPANEAKFQLIAPGLDDHYGSFAAVPTMPTDLKQYPDGVRYSTEDKDNLVNFSGSNLEDSIP
jgi:prepilin-type N-terminal cleavage/methylation domain-containing protein